MIHPLKKVNMIPLHQPIDFNRLGKRLKALFTIEDIRSFSFVHGGFMSQNFRLKTEQGDFFLKQYRNRLNHLLYEITTAEEFFSGHGLPIITPIKDHHGRSVFWFEGHWLSLFPFVDGRSPAYGKIDDRIIQSMGELLARFHLAGKQFPEKHFQWLRAWDKRKFFLEKVELIDLLKKKNPLSELDELMLTVLEKKSTFVEKNTLRPSDIPLPFDTLLHGDFIYQNVFVNERGLVTHVYDLEKTCMGPRAYEIGRSLMINCFDDGWEEKQYRLGNQFLRAYQEFFPLTYEEFALGIRMYATDVAHMTWIEAKYLIYQEKKLLELYTRHANRIQHTEEALEEMAESVYYGSRS
ncbi:phosphotransferase [Candidatus Uhrbacteria bacterium]|nr:phosphotransferase [Candidatus Uhrbacteria bacterium]